MPVYSSKVHPSDEERKEVEQKSSLRMHLLPDEVNNKLLDEEKRKEACACDEELDRIYWFGDR